MNKPTSTSLPSKATGPVDPVSLAKRSGGRLVRHPGGFWGAVDWDHRKPYASTEAVQEMVRDGLAYVSVSDTDRFRRTIPTEVRLKPQST